MPNANTQRIPELYVSSESAKLNKTGEEYSAFVEVHVATSLEEWEQRNRNGLYRLAPTRCC